MPINWSQSYNVEWRLMPVNKDTWADMSISVGSGYDDIKVKSVHIDRDATSSIPMLESVSIDLEYPITSDVWKDGWYRFEGLFTQAGYSERIPIVTFLTETNDGDTNFGMVSSTVEGYSVLKPASDRAMLLGSYVPKGVNGAEYAADLLRECIFAPVVVDGKFTLDDYLAYGEDTSYLKTVWDLLDAGSFCMAISGDGTVTIKPKPTGYAIKFTAETENLLFPKMSYTRDRSSIPNVYRAISGSSWYEAVNDNPSSELSTVSRGRRVDAVDTSPRRVNGETLRAYAERRLEEESTYYKTYKYTREYMPGVMPFDLVAATLPQYAFEGSLRVMSQSINCGAAITVDETAAEVIKEYKAK